MKKIFVFCLFCLMSMGMANVFVSCSSCCDKKVDDVSEIPGIYEGQAELQIPDNLKKMIKPDSTGKSPIPDGPLPCKLEIKKNAEDKLTIELVDFKMPMEGMTMTPSSCEVTEDGEAFALSGEGKVMLGKNGSALSYVHEGKIEGSDIHLEGTVYIIPKLLGVKIVFNGVKS